MSVLQRKIPPGVLRLEADECFCLPRTDEGGTAGELFSDLSRFREELIRQLPAFSTRPVFARTDEE